MKNPNASPTLKRGFGLSSFGRSAEVRTLGLVVPNHARYQLRHTPIDIKMSYHILFYFSDIVNKNMIIKTNFLDLFFVNSHKKASCF